MRWEGRIWCGLIRGVARRPDIPTGAAGFTHHRALAPVRWIGVLLLIVEVVVVDLIVPSGVLRVALLLVGLYSLIWLTCYLLGSGPVRPHLVTDERVVLRCGLTTEIAVPLDVIDQVRALRHGRTGTATIQVEDQVLSLVDNGGTSLELVLDRTLTANLPRGRTAPVMIVRAWVDDASAMAGAIGRAIRDARRPPTAPPSTASNERCAEFGQRIHLHCARWTNMAEPVQILHSAERSCWTP